jgi:hypothetical protein
MIAVITPLLERYAIYLYAAGLLLVLAGLWSVADLWTAARERRRSVSKQLVANITRAKTPSALAQITAKDWSFILGITLLTAVLTHQPVMTIGAAIILYLTRAFFGADPMEARVTSTEANITWMAALTYLLQTSKTAWESLMISANSLPHDVGKDLREALRLANVSIGGHVIRLRDALTLFAVKREDPQVDVVVAMVNANITSSGSETDYEVMHQIKEQLKDDLAEQHTALAARRELFTIAKIMFPTVVIMETLLAAFMGSFIAPYYETVGGNIVLIVIEAVSVALLLLFRKFSAPLPETRLIVPETFREQLGNQVAAVDLTTPREDVNG